METASGPSRVSRVGWRYRPRAEHVASAQGNTPNQAREEEEPRPVDADEPLLAREQRGRTVMGEGHRQFHRRAAQAAPNILTVNVNVEQTIDIAGNVVGVATVTPVLPVVPAVPTVGVPTVPTVPAFPSDLNVPTVPAYPFSSVAASPTEPAPTPAPAPTTTEPSSILPTTLPATYSGFNSTTSSCECTAPCLLSRLTKSSRNIIHTIVLITQ